MATLTPDDYIDSVGHTAEAATPDIDAYIDATSKLPPAAPVPPSAASDIGPGFVRGVRDVTDTVAHMATMNPLVHRMAPTEYDKHQQAREQSVAEYNKRYGQSGYATAGRVGGNIVGTTPLLLAGGELAGAVPGVAAAGEALQGAGTVGRMLQSAGVGGMQGAGAGALTSQGYGLTPGEGAAEGGILGTLLGPIAPIVTNAVTRGYRAAMPLVRNGLNELIGNVPEQTAARIAPTITEQGAPVVNALTQRGINVNNLAPSTVSRVADEASAQLTHNGAVDPESLARVTNFADLGITPTRSMITRDYLDWSDEYEAAKNATGRPIERARVAANTRLGELLDEQAAATGGAAGNIADAGESVTQALRAKWNELQGNVHRLYTDIRAARGDEAATTATGLLQTMGTEADSTDAIPIITSIQNRLRRYGVLDREGNHVGDMTFQQAEELRKFIGQQSGNAAFKRQFISALDNDVVSDAGEDAFGPARESARSRFAEFERSKVNNDVVNEAEGASPDYLIKRYVIGNKADSEDLRGLQDTLTNPTGLHGQPATPLQVQRGTQAWNDLRQQVAQHIRDESELRDGTISPVQLERTLLAIGPRKMSILFGPEGAQRYQQILRAAQDVHIEPQLSPMNRSHSAVQVENRLRQAIPEIGRWLQTIGLGGAALGEPASLILNAGSNLLTSRAERQAAADAAQAAQQRVNFHLTPSAATPEPAAPVRPMTQRPRREVLTTPATVGTINALTQQNTSPQASQ